MPSPEEEAWMVEGLCRRVPEPDRIFFPLKHKGVPTDYRKAKAICNQCPVQRDCLFFAIAYGESHGVWGGMSDRERKRVSPRIRHKVQEYWLRQFPGATFARRVSHGRR